MVDVNVMKLLSGKLIIPISRGAIPLILCLICPTKFLFCSRDSSVISGIHTVDFEVTAPSTERGRIVSCTTGTSMVSVPFVIVAKLYVWSTPIVVASASTFVDTPQNMPIIAIHATNFLSVYPLFSLSFAKILFVLVIVRIIKRLARRRLHTGSFIRIIHLF